MRIGVVGLGVVGSAVYNGFKKHYEVVGYDKNKESDPFDGLLECDVIFACLPTPTQMSRHTHLGLGTGQSIQPLLNTMAELRRKEYTGIVAVKSTVLPGTCFKIQKTNPDMKIVSNPEFLSAKTADDDFIKQKKVLIGTPDLKAANVLLDLYKKVGVKEAFVVNHTEAETIKYMHNVFLAVKVATFNEFYDVCKERKTNYQLCADLACEITGWINPRHVEVPGPDGSFGFGGACFPKDTEAFLVKYHHLDLDTVKGAVMSNNARRKGGKKADLPKRDAYKKFNLNEPTHMRKKRTKVG